MPSIASTSPAPCRPRRSFPRTLLAGAVLILLVLPAAAQEEEDLTSGLTSLKIHLDRGRELFNELKFADAIVELSHVVEMYQGGKLLQDFGDRELQMVAQALDLRGRAYFNQGERELAKRDFAQLLRVRIDYRMDTNLISPKVVKLFEEVKKETLSTLSVSSDPPGAEVYLNDEPLPRTPIVGRPAIAGTYRLRLALKGFQDYQEELTIQPRSEAKREIRLTPNTRTLQFITQPSGVNVIVNDQLVGTTFGSLPPDQASVAKNAGLDPLRTSAPLLVKYVPPGPHEVLFEKECYEPDLRAIQVTLDTQGNTPQAFQPILLKENRGQIKITSHPSGADVFVDGRMQGTTPIQLPAICAGEREIRLVKKEGGTWFERVRIQPDAVNLLDATLRPTLLYLGTFRLDEWGRLTWSDEDKLLLEQLAGLKSVNQVRPDDSLKAFRTALEDEMARPEYAERLRQGTGLPAARVLDAATRFQADLILAVISLQDQPGRGAPTAFLYSSEQPDPDAARLDLSDSGAVKAFVTALDRAPDLTRAWTGATFSDTLLGEGPLVVRVIKGGPAAAGGLMPGDQVDSANGKKTASVPDLTAVSSGLKPGDRLRLSIRRQGSTRTVDVTIGRTPVLVPMNSPDLLYNKALCDYRQLSRGGDDPMDRALALVNLGICFIHFRSFDKALSEALNVASLPPGFGISRGTVRYYQGLCYLKKELVPEARTAFQEAAALAEATLESNDGPPVAPRARKLLQ